MAGAKRPAMRIQQLLCLLLGAALGLPACVSPESPPADDGYGDSGKADGASSDPAGCVFDASDRFEPHERIPAGKYRGRCYDTRRARPVVQLDDTQAAPYGGRAQGELVIANVFHDHGFWVAHVPVDGIEEVLFQLEYFPAIVPAGHTQMRIRFRADAPVRLVGQSARNAGQTVEMRDLVFSVEAVGQPGYKYDIVRGIVNEFGTAYRVASLESRLDEMVVKQGHVVEQWQLELEPSETQRLLANYVRESDERNMQTMYNTLFVNCTNEAIRILDESVTYTVAEQVGRFLAKVTEFYPNIVRAALIARGLLPIDQSTDWPHLDQDPTVADLLADLGGR
jgi:hypothetical protein